MEDSKKQRKNKYVKTQEELKDPANTDNFPPPEFITKPAPGDTGYAIVAAAFHDQTEYFRPGIKSQNNELAKTRNGKEKPNRVYEHVLSYDEFLNEATNVSLEQLLDWASTNIVDKTIGVEDAIEKFAKSKSIEPEDISKIAVYLLHNDLEYVGTQTELDLDQATLIELIKKIDELYGTQTEF